MCGFVCFSFSTAYITNINGILPNDAWFLIKELSFLILCLFLYNFFWSYQAYKMYACICDMVMYNKHTSKKSIFKNFLSCIIMYRRAPWNQKINILFIYLFIFFSSPARFCFYTYNRNVTYHTGASGFILRQFFCL